MSRNGHTKIYEIFPESHQVPVKSTDMYATLTNSVQHNLSLEAKVV